MKLILIVSVTIIANQLFSDVLYKITGKAVYEGLGVNNIGIECTGIDKRVYKETITDKEGNFYFYVSNGEYRLNILDEKRKGFVSNDVKKLITVDGKNIKNVIFFLEKECKVSGFVKFEDNTPIENVGIHVVNNRSYSMSETDSNGIYLVSGLRESDNTIVKSVIPGVQMEIIENLVLTEGTVLENINFIVQKNLSLKGKVIDKDTKEIIKDAVIMIFDGYNNFPASQNEENGEFSAYNLEKKQYTIIVDRPGFYVKTKSILFSGEILNIEIEIEKEI